MAGPTGEWLLPPTAGTDGLLIVDIDPAVVRAERQNFDPTGHYSRPDVFEVIVNRTRRQAATFRDD